MFSIYKNGQGKYTRLGTASVLGVIFGLGSYQLYKTLEPHVGLWVETMVPAGLFVLLALFVVWLVNKPAFADFMIAAEGEMKKVNWSSRQEIIVSTVVVIIMVILFSALLGATDLIFSMFFSWLLS